MRALRRRDGVTLIELLVSMSILVMLGMALIVILRGGLSAWRQAEARRESYDQAQAIFLQLREDLSSVIPPFDTPLSGMGEVEARFLCDRDRGNRQRLFLVRSIKAESEHPITGLAGTTIGADAVIDFRNDLSEARQARLRSTGGAMEVAWVLGKDGVLYRGARSPIGPPHSLFSNVEPYELVPPLPPMHPEAPPPPKKDDADEKKKKKKKKKEPDPRQFLPPEELPSLLRPFANNVIYIEYKFWTQYTLSWSTKHPPLRDPDADERPGPMTYWDSTRALLKAEDPDPKIFDTYISAKSLYDPRDDILPAKVRIKIVIEQNPYAKSTTYLLEPVGKKDREIEVQNPEMLNPDDGGYIYIHGEWIRYTGVSGTTVEVAKRGRGVRGTRAKDHNGDHPVVIGHTLVAVFDIPGYREDWGDYVRFPR